MEKNEEIFGFSSNLMASEFWRSVLWEFLQMNVRKKLGIRIETFEFQHHFQNRYF
ncbi:hypothetical protein LEP1GSC024_2637 [Leptospira noguchii str. 2001034031]|uniref:Uncharacterized protein n=1 Tax=Leptospira noguchii str. 2001034031 TaxID=1193053 RepID=M6YPQ5_9LEPT|nr:hypothetical protein LEP1GSC024_2637 [Leptospira noguchii str. 2001034031]